MFESLCYTSEGNQHVKETKASLLVQQYEPFKMKDHEDIETVFFKVSNSGVWPSGP